MSRRSDVEDVTADLLRRWPLPDPGGDKKARGTVAVVGGSRRTPGGVVLAGEAALRVGAGRLRVFAPHTIEVQLGTVLPEAAILSLPEAAGDPIQGRTRNKLAAAAAVLLGPGFDDAEQTRDTIRAVADLSPPCLVLDAYALGVLPSLQRRLLPDALVLTPNRDELALLLEREPDDMSDDLATDVREAAERHGAVVTCFDVVAAPDGRAWRVGEGGPGLATSGSGDVLSGAVTGFVGRGADAAQAAVWGTWTHGRAGDRLTERMGIGFLARELAAELPLAVREVS